MNFVFKATEDPDVVEAYPTPSVAVPTKHVVVRRAPSAHTEDDVPAAVWFLPRRGNVMPSYMRTANIIRQETHDIIVSILAWVEREAKQENGEASDSGPGRDSTAMDLYAAYQLQPPSAVSITVEPTDHLFPPFPIPLVPQPPISELDSYPNPFEGPGGSLSLEYHGLILTGLPGIGKTYLLYAIFALRVACDLPTLFMSAPDTVFIWQKGKYTYVKRLGLPQLFSLPRNTWCLIDSDHELPNAVLESRLFVVQAASPHEQRLQWQKKNPGTLGLQNNYKLGPRFVSEAQIVEFYTRYGGSARDAYSYVYDSRWEAIVTGAARQVQRQSIISALQATTPNSNIPHTLLSVFPLTDRDRRLFVIKAPSHAAYTRMLRCSRH
ncbi:hypothetical protein B0H16DRAFT_1709561 [Mycena metata]|uniref:Uncharacterized protein n=1 Tax=Mycena metata TaxID=1033252 RepID=A0AAD7P0I3_9AGAR|nr:hypothetical protein B0H16DRAFT_1709561 [Mycena metata]